MSPFKYHQPHTGNKGNVSSSCHFLKWLQTRFNHCVFFIVTVQSNLRCSKEKSSNFRNKLHFLHNSSGFNSKKYCYLHLFLKKCLDPSTSATFSLKVNSITQYIVFQTDGYLLFLVREGNICVITMDKENELNVLDL